MPDLADFLAARLGEDEFWAHEASLFDDHPNPKYVEGGMHWQWQTGHGEPIELDPTTMTYVGEGADRIRDAGGVLMCSIETRATSVGELSDLVIHEGWETRVPAAAHIARHDPAHVLADIAAKRAIVAEHARIPLHNQWVETGSAGRQQRTVPVCRACQPNWLDIQYGKTVWPCRTLQLLALPFADHPDYDPAWRIDA